MPDVNTSATGRSGSSASGRRWPTPSPSPRAADAQHVVDAAGGLDDDLAGRAGRQIRWSRSRGRRRAASSTAARSDAREPRVDARGDRADAAGRQVQDEELGHLRQHERDHVAFADHTVRGQADRPPRRRAGRSRAYDSVQPPSATYSGSSPKRRAASAATRPSIRPVRRVRARADGRRRRRRCTADADCDAMIPSRSRSAHMLSHRPEYDGGWRSIHTMPSAATVRRLPRRVVEAGCVGEEAFRRDGHVDAEAVDGDRRLQLARRVDGQPFERRPSTCRTT